MSGRVPRRPYQFHIVVVAQVKNMAVLDGDEFIILVDGQVLLIELEPDVVAVLVKQITQVL